ncbi:MAG: thioredoxin family protein [Alphaproteobacteria bacterium]|nr:thioredoxin family protein [Alphaproteobacteria bacterium]
MAAAVGAPAPDFQCTDSAGNIRSLSEFKGKTVVLEWTNRQCPFVRKHYDGGNMQALQKKCAGQGVVWLSVVSSAPGNQGYVTAPEANEHVKAVGASPAAVLLDADGKVGRLYGAQTTPHVFVVDGAGKLAYAGAIDDKSSTSAADIKGAKNYVADALDALKTGKPVATASTKAYGCGVKYAG